MNVLHGKKSQTFSLLLLAGLFLDPQPIKAADPVDSDPGLMVLYGDFYGGGSDARPALFQVDSHLGVWTMIQGYPRRNGPAPIHAYRISPDRKFLAYNELEPAENRLHVRPSGVWIVPLGQGASAKQVSRIRGRPIWAPDSQHLLIVESTGDGQFQTWKIGLEGEDPVRVPIPDELCVEDWSADGRWFLGVRSTGENKERSQLVRLQPDGTGLEKLSDSGLCLWPRFSPDGNRIVYTAIESERRVLTILNLTSGQSRGIETESDDSFIEKFVWSPDGRKLAGIRLNWSRDENGSPILGGDSLGRPELVVLDLETEQLHEVPQAAARVLMTPDWR